MNFGLVSRLLSVVLIIIALAFALCLCASIFLDEDIDQNLTTAAFGVSLQPLRCSRRASYIGSGEKRLNVSIAVKLLA